MTSSPLKWIGGKAASAQRIVAAFPLHSLIFSLYSYNAEGA